MYYTIIIIIYNILLTVNVQLEYTKLYTSLLCMKTTVYAYNIRIQRTSHRSFSTAQYLGSFFVSHFKQFVLPLAAARWTGVAPFWARSIGLHCSSTTNHSTIEMWPKRAARWRGVAWAQSLASASHPPFRTNHSRHSSCPVAAAS